MYVGEVKSTSKYHNNLSKKEIELMEKLAYHEHTRWADWQKYLHSKMEITRATCGDIIYFPTELYKHWERQIKTDYKNLSEQEKDSDREQVMRYFNLIKGV